MSRRLGYAYRCRISTDDEILSSYKQQWMDWRNVTPVRCFVIEIRTNFTLKPTGLDAEILDSEREILDSERFALILWVKTVDKYSALMSDLLPRLSDYWMPLDDVQALARAAADYLTQRMPPAGDHPSSSPHAIPMAIDVEVCTVQLKGESIDLTVDRSMKTDCLIPYHLHMIGEPEKFYGSLSILPSGEGPMEDNGLRLYCLNLAEYRVEQVVKGLARMKACPVCLRPPVFGSVLTTLPCHYNHVFHKHCIVRKLLLDKSCPVCPCKIMIPK